MNKSDCEIGSDTPYCVRFGVFWVPRAETAETRESNTGRSWGHLGYVDPNNADCRVFFLGKPIVRGRIAAVQWGYRKTAPGDDEVDQFVPTQQATLDKTWCPLVDLGKDRWNKFMAQDPTVREELAKLVDALRRTVSGYDGDKEIYHADNLLAKYDTIKDEPIHI